MFEDQKTYSGIICLFVEVEGIFCGHVRNIGFHASRWSVGGSFFHGSFYCHHINCYLHVVASTGYSAEVRPTMQATTYPLSHDLLLAWKFPESTFMGAPSTLLMEVVDSLVARVNTTIPCLMS